MVKKLACFGTIMVLAGLVYADAADKIAGPLNALSGSAQRGGIDKARSRYPDMPVSGFGKQGSAEEIFVICRPVAGISAREITSKSLSRFGGRLDAVSESYLRIQIVPDRIELLAEHPHIAVIRQQLPPITCGGLGSFISESVELIHAREFHEQGVSGNGVKVGVIDADFHTLQETIDSGELPQNTVWTDFSGTGIENGSIHGVGVSEQVMDVAPGAELHCLKIRDIVDLENAAEYLRQNNVPVVNMSLSWQGMSYFDDTGPYSEIVNNSYDNDGVFWVTASGNKGNSHWRGLWEDTDANAELDFDSISNRLHAIEPYETVTVYLNWDQYGMRRPTDLDLYIVDENDSLIAFSSTYQSISRTPLEVAQFHSKPEKDYYIVVVLAGGSADGLDVTVFVNQAGLDPVVKAYSLAEPACAHGAFTVTAISRESWITSSPKLQKYAGHGPTTDGRLKPEISAPDATSSSSFGENGS
ncbi:MAG: S8 family serine peptidase [Chitinivibrionales bacterium]|nr:S8 family serine peptidase [Chitinivibrionales bacterium]